MQYGCLNFHAKRDGGPKLSLAIKNKWSTGWMKSWFYCRIPRLCSSEGGKSVHILHSWMSALDYMIEPEVECLDDDLNDISFIRVTITIGDRDTIEEFVACKMFPLACGFSFKDVTVGMTPVSKIQTLLPLFPVEPVSAEDAAHVLVEVETEAERFLWSFGLREYDALMTAKLPNGGRLNRVFEKMGVAYAPHLLPGSEASQAARDKWKAEVSKKLAAKRAKTGTSWDTPSKTAPPLCRGAPPPSNTAPPLSKAGPSKKIGVVKVICPRVKAGLQGTSEIELALAKPVGISKKFCLLDVAAPSHGLHGAGLSVAHAGERAARVASFDNLGDDLSPDVCQTPPPKKAGEKCAAPPPSISG
jgi:hypothetical protein